MAGRWYWSPQYLHKVKTFPITLQFVVGGRNTRFLSLFLTVGSSAPLFKEYHDNIFAIMLHPVSIFPNIKLKDRGLEKLKEAG